MSSKQSPASKMAAPSAANPAVDPAAAPPSSPALAEVKKPRKPKSPSMSMRMKFDVLTAINGADPKSPDATVAAALSVTHSRPISEQQVGKYRKELGLASVGKPKQADLLAYLAAANARIAALEAAASAPGGSGGSAGEDAAAGRTD